MDVADFDYELPPSAIAQDPIEPRDAARLLVDLGPGTSPRDATVRDLPGLVGPGDVVVVNATRVLPARLHLRKDSGGAVEVFLLEAEAPIDAAASAPVQSWRALVRPGRRVPPGTRLVADDDLAVVVGERLEDGVRRVEVETADLDAALARHGEVPLPPYLDTDLDDPDRYQTVYAHVPGSVAAPTAGLHLTDDVLDQIRARGAQIVEVVLWVGLGTFRPIATDAIEDHVMHTERYEVPEETWTAVRSAERVIAIGTTSVRALESAARSGSLTGRTDLYLTPGCQFRVVDVLLTNFHLPRSSLLVLVEAFMGPRWRELYAHALASGYRFLSFGDAMLLSRVPSDGSLDR